MVRGLRRAGVAAVVALVLVTGATGSSVPLRGTLLERSFASKALKGSIGFDVYLPPGYSTTRTRYPVVYFLHGLPASASAFRGTGTIAKEIDAARRSAILVGPQGARDGDSDPEYLDWGTGRNWETALGTELPRYVDSHFRTIRGRRGRALVGLSAGGYGAVLLALHRLDAFSVIESWSGYFHPTDPSGKHPLDLGSTAANARASAHALVGSLRADERRRPTFLAFYVGNGDRRFRAENEQFDAELRAAKIPHVFRVYAGGHESAVWSAHAGDWLGLALQHLRPAA